MSSLVNAITGAVAPGLQELPVVVREVLADSEEAVDDAAAVREAERHDEVVETADPLGLTLLRVRRPRRLGGDRLQPAVEALVFREIDQLAFQVP
jgi:hypothetical protein